MWKFALVLAFAHGAFCVAPGIYWVLETLKCSENRVIVEPNKNLVETPEALDQMCERQNEFYRCIENVLSLQDLDIVVGLPPVIQHERSIFNGLCSEDSTWRRRYLEFAPCINRQQTDFCKTPEFLGADGGRDQSPCTLQEKTTNCIAATLTMKCSIEAGHLFHHLQKLRSDDCEYEQIETCPHSEPMPDGNKSKTVFDEIYDQLTKKIGNIEDQDIDSFNLHKRVGDSREESQEFENEIATVLSDIEDNLVPDSHIEDSVPDSHIMNADYLTEEKERIMPEDYESVSEMITSALDALDENLVTDIPMATDHQYHTKDSYHEEPEIVLEKRSWNLEKYEFQNEVLSDTEDASVPESHIINTDYSSENVENIMLEDYESAAEQITSASDTLDVNLATYPSIAGTGYPSYAKNTGYKIPEATIEKVLRINKDYWQTIRIFPDGRINHYERFKYEHKPIESIECGHLLGRFRCVYWMRLQDISCLEPVVYTGPMRGEFFPEEFDPEFGAKLYETVPQQKYVFEQLVNKSTEILSNPVSYNPSTEGTQTSYFADKSQNVGDKHYTQYTAIPNMGQELMIENLFTESKSGIRGSGDGLELSQDTDAHVVSESNSGTSESTTAETESATLKELVDVFTTAWPSLSGMIIKGALPEKIYDAYEDLYTLKTGFLKHAKTRNDVLGNYFLYWDNQQNTILDKVTCGRVNECHPRGKDMWKCVIVTRETGEKCNGCETTPSTNE